MNHHFVFLFSLVSIVLCGCSLDDVKERGDDCPPNKEGAILYIYSPEFCTEKNCAECPYDSHGTVRKLDFSENFVNKQCPWQYPKCQKNETADGIQYACIEKQQEMDHCVEGLIECQSDENINKVKCINPAHDETCGASHCSVEDNYGAVNCRLFDARCEETGYGKYACVKKTAVSENSDEKTEIICAKITADPSNPETCGACTCSLPNFGATRCSIFETCQKIENRYQCMPLACDVNACLITSEEGVPACVNTKIQCGSQCDNCTSIHSNAECQDGTCVITKCMDDETPVLENDVIIQCTRADEPAD